MPMDLAFCDPEHFAARKKHHFWFYGKIECFLEMDLWPTEL
jgi:hypothetical protein